MDLNKEIRHIQKISLDIEKQLKTLLIQYEELCREGNKQFNNERTISGSMNGLEDFYRLIQTLKRNKDLIGSLFRGIKGLRPLTGFKIVEEDFKPKAEPKHKKEQVPVHEESFETETIEE